MSGYRAVIDWRLDGDFRARRYSRAHTVTFDGGLAVKASASPHIVPLPYSVEGAMDPEAAFTAALSACHMLWFLDLAAQAGFEVASYRDAAEGTLARNAEGRMAMTRVVLKPEARFVSDPRPDREALEALHHRAHEACFIANSVKTEVLVEPVVTES